MRVGAEDWNFSANILRRMQSTFAQNVRGHCRCGGFAMHSGDDNPALRLHNCCYGFRAAGQRLAAMARGQEDWIVVLDCGGKDNKLSCVRVLRPMLIVETQAESLQSIRLCGCCFVRAAHCMSQ